jgi:UDP-3-O-[3-hydroxymyristoyl] glucosamine N-acyltransferase
MRWRFVRDTRVAVKQQTHSAGSLGAMIGARIQGSPDIPCTGCAALHDALEGELTFMLNAKYTKLWEDSSASIGIVPNNVEVPWDDTSKRTLLWVDNVEVAMTKILALFAGEDDLPAVGIHPSAVVSTSATMGKDVRIGPFVEIADTAVIGDRVSLHAHTRIGKGAQVGAGTVLYAGVVIGQRCSLGKDCILNANVVIGTDGFGYCPSENQSHLIKIPHIGTVKIGDCVEIGSNSCVDRGKFSATTIGSGTKLDNLVQIAHNCIIGKNCAISSGTALAGSVTIGDWVQLGGDVGISPHCVIGDGVKIGAKSGVMHDIPAGEEWLGVPAVPVREMLRQWSSTRKLPAFLAAFARKNKEQ